MARDVAEWIGRDDNEPVPARVRVRVFLRDGGKCRSCGRTLRSGDKSECDHITALVNGGSNTESNLQTLCEWCHKGKTAMDSREKSVTYRKRKSNMGLKKPRTILGWRRFSGEIVRAPRDR